MKVMIDDMWKVGAAAERMVYNGRTPGKGTESFGGLNKDVLKAAGRLGIVLEEAGVLDRKPSKGHGDVGAGVEE